MKRAVILAGIVTLAASGCVEKKDNQASLNVYASETSRGEVEQQPQGPVQSFLKQVQAAKNHLTGDSDKPLSDRAREAYQSVAERFFKKQEEKAAELGAKVDFGSHGKVLCSKGATLGASLIVSKTLAPIGLEKVYPTGAEFQNEYFAYRDSAGIALSAAVDKFCMLIWGLPWNDFEKAQSREIVTRGVDAQLAFVGGVRGGMSFGTITDDRGWPHLVGVYVLGLKGGFAFDLSAQKLVIQNYRARRGSSPRNVDHLLTRVARLEKSQSQGATGSRPAAQSSNQGAGR